MIYIHVPFCRSFCTYCDFYSEIACKGRDAAAIEVWADGVCEEISARRDEIAATLDLDTLYIGGGTPSVLPLSVLQQVISCINTAASGEPFAPLPLLSGAPPLTYPASPELPTSPQSGSVPLSAGHAEACLLTRAYQEFTIEVNPEDIVERGPEYVRGLLELGVTRISMGVQSLDDGILRWMNRRHSADGAREAFRLLQGSISSPTALTADADNAPPSKAGPLPLSRGWRRSCEEISPASSKRADISIDLIIGVPGMTEEILEATLEEVIGWRPEHISAYQLSIEEDSTLARMIEQGEVQELDEEACRAQYDLVCQRLRDAGYHHYEISNWALPGHEAIHNSAYWTRHPYVGLGPAAHSFLYYESAPAFGRAMQGPGSPCGTRPCPLPVADGKRIIQRRSWNSQVLSGWTSEGEDLSPEQIHTEEVMLLARTDRGPIPESDWFIADEIIPGLI